MRPSGKAWLALGAGIGTYNVLCPDGETLSEGADDAMVRHRWLVLWAAFTLVGHVCNLVNPRYDLLHWVFVIARKRHI